MAKPRVFISSTYSDLSEVRNKVRDYVIENGYEPVCFEKDEIPYTPNKNLEESCYEEVKECSMFILLLKSNFGQPTDVKYVEDIIVPEQVKSVTQLEYLFAKKCGMPIFVFIYQPSFDEFMTFKDQDFDKKFKFNYLDGYNHALFVKELFVESNKRFFYKFNQATDIIETLRKQWAGLFNKYLKDFQHRSLEESSLIFINCYKLFYFRKNRGLTQDELSKRSSISLSTIQKLEDVGLKFTRIDTKDFKRTTLKKARLIADVLECSVGNIRAEMPDDYLTFYLSYYYRNKGLRNKRETQKQSLKLFQTKAVVFDFDGTLTEPRSGETTWEKIWLDLGYGLEECGELHQKFSRAEISHKTWCNLTAEKFKDKGLTKNQLIKISKSIKLISGVEETLKELNNSGVSLYICSGSIDTVIRNVLKNYTKYFDEIKSNRFKYKQNGELDKIIGTKFDFEGKSDYLTQVAMENDINPYEILFIGNSLNDEWAHQSGALTLCVNPRLTNPNQHIQWTYAINRMNNLKEILKFVNREGYSA
jgi:HAD superfamily phosphoserine phosphatase-like hydrolase